MVGVRLQWRAWHQLLLELKADCTQMVCVWLRNKDTLTAVEVTICKGCGEVRTSAPLRVHHRTKQ